MEDLLQKFKHKNKTNEDETTSKTDNTYQTGKSRSSSISSNGEDRESRKRKKMEEEPETENTTLEEIRKERTKLEEFLFNDNNKISKSAAKFILGKWAIMEAKLQDEIIENKRLATLNQNARNVDVKTYSQVTASGTQTRITKGPMKTITKDITEVILLKPIDEKDKRNNDEIKTAAIQQLSEIKTKIKVKSIRQMRQKGIVVEVQDKDDVELINKVNMEAAGLKIEKPKKMLPSIVIYDIEKEAKAEELKEDFIAKNFNDLTSIERAELKYKVNFRHNFKTKEDKVNWIVQIPGRYMNKIISTQRVFMQWRTYRVREYINVTRCFKCHGYGHIAKNCSSTDQLCETCGSKDHLKKDCDKKDLIKCINCYKAKRRETNHHVRSKECPELIKQIERYKTRIDWA